MATFSGTRFAAVYFAAQAIAVPGWWVALYVWPESRRLFMPSTSPETDLLAFWLPDLFAAAGSGVAGALAWRRNPWAPAAGWFSAGAMAYAALYCLSWALLTGEAWLAVAMMVPAAAASVVCALDLSAPPAFVFRRARPASPRRNILKTLIQVAAFWSFFLWVIPATIVYVEARIGIGRFSFPGQVAVGIILFLLCSALGLASGLTMARLGHGTPLPFDAPNELVVRGPYACIRNPMVVAGLGQGAAVALLLGSWGTLLYTFAGGVVWHALVRPAEETDLLRQFGQSYAAYRSAVRCWVPRLSPWKGQGGH